MMQSAATQANLLVKLRSSRWPIGVAIAVGGSTAVGLWRFHVTASAPPSPVTVSAPASKTVTALERLAPRGEVIKLSAPTANQGNRVDRLLVQEGDRVKTRQVIAILESYDRLKAALAEAQAEVSVAQAKLEVTKTGAKQGEIDSQQAEVERLAAENQGNIEAQAAIVARWQAELQNA